jgi:hypothetical protein
VRYLRSNDFLETEGTDTPITDQDPIADLVFNLEIDRVGKIISGISKQSPFRTDFKRRKVRETIRRHHGPDRLQRQDPSG